MEPKHLGFSQDESKEADYKRMKANVMEDIRRIFKPEFLNRIDDILVFRPLTKDDMKSIVTIMTKSLVERAKTQLNIDLNIKPAAKTYIVDQAYDPKYGARPLRRKIQTDLEDVLAEKILGNEIKPGDHVAVTVKKGKLVFES
jgi:ATP-dependent Clp protease ATP-binding subunit ClpC